MHETQSKAPGELFFSLILLLVSCVLFWQAYQIDEFSSLKSPGAFPMAAAAVMFVTSSITFYNTAVKHFRVDGLAKKRISIMPLPVVIILATLLAFAVVVESVGFLITAYVFLFITIKFLYQSGFLKTAALSLAVLAVIYVVFRLVFQVVLPEGIVPEREIIAWFESLFK
ncbi:MAG: tripartite tricarboxylate transporter TctB family protein [Oceanospirillaceae bacterium]|nr:tripartite tricarboxylate transporter TctB family protein [Oceanospirillaceae bacterium]